MDTLKQNLDRITSQIAVTPCTLVAVTKTHPVDTLRKAYDLGLKTFGENKVQEMVSKQEALPKDIEWHMIGHLQRNKVKYIAPFVALIHSIDSVELLQEVHKQATKNQRVIPCLLQIHIAEEETKFGFDFQEVASLLKSPAIETLIGVRIVGLMGMATNTDDQATIRSEFKKLRQLFESLRIEHPGLSILSMGMSGDYPIALEEGSTMIRVGSALFGSRPTVK